MELKSTLWEFFPFYTNYVIWYEFDLSELNILWYCSFPFMFVHWDQSIVFGNVFGFCMMYSVIHSSCCSGFVLSVHYLLKIYQRWRTIADTMFLFTKNLHLKVFQLDAVLLLSHIIKAFPFSYIQTWIYIQIHMWFWSKFVGTMFWFYRICS